MDCYAPGLVLEERIFLVSAAETIGDTSALVSGGLDREITKEEISGAIAVDGFANILSARFLSLNQSINHIGQMLNSLSYKNVLSRGYAIVRDSDNKIITKTDAGTPATIEFADGVLKL